MTRDDPHAIREAASRPAMALEAADIGPGIVRLRIGRPDPRASYLADRGPVPGPDPAPADASAPDRPRRAMDARPSPSGFELAADGRTALRLVSGRATAADGVELVFELVGEQHLYGLGGAALRLDRLGETRRFWNAHVNHATGSDIAVPLVVSSAGFGLFFDHSGEACLDPGDSNDDVLLRYRGAGEGLDVYVLAGGSLRETASLVARLLGHAPMPPRWALGFLQSTRDFDGPDDIPDLAREFRRRAIPCDALILLSTYTDQKGWNRGVGHLDWHPAVVPDPAALVGALRRENMRLVTHEYAVVNPASPLFEEGRSGGHLLDDGYPVVDVTQHPSNNYREGQRYLDPSRPETRAWWWDRHRALTELGIDGWWLDGGEGPSAETRLAAGPGALLHNRFDLLRQQAFHEGETRDRPDRRPFLLCRSGGPGMQRFGAAHWSGDVNATFPTLAAQVATGLNVAMSGIPYWGTDIGGYYPTQDGDELFVRWFQFGAFCPLFRAHGRNWRQHLPWGRGPLVERICREFIALRYRLMPYLYTLAWEAHARGLPLLRPLVFDEPHDPAAWDGGGSFLLGDDILVAPVTQDGARTWPVRLPGGPWHDLWTGQPYAGGCTVLAEAPLERCPVFVRGGAVVPTGPALQHDEPGLAEELTLLVFPTGSAERPLYEDDGHSQAYRTGGYRLSRLRCERNGRLVELSTRPEAGAVPGAPTPRYRFKVFAPGPITSATHVSGAGRTRPADWREVDGTFALFDAVPPGDTLRLEFEAEPPP